MLRGGISSRETVARRALGSLLLIGVTVTSTIRRPGRQHNESFGGRIAGLLSRLLQQSAYLAAAGAMIVLLAPQASADEGAYDIDSFDAGVGAWTGSGLQLTSVSGGSGGSKSASLAYDVAGGPAEMRLNAPAELPMNVHSDLRVDLKGDGTFNTLYAQVIDGSGEVFVYRLDSLNVANWKTVSVRLATPVSSSAGNADKELDGPLTLSKLYITRNGTQPSSGVAQIDNVRVTNHGWTLPVSAKSVVSSDASESTDISFVAGTSGDYTLTLRDNSGGVWSTTGSATGGGSQSVPWNGRGSNGVPLRGVVTATLSYDTAVDGVVAAGSPKGSKVNVLSVRAPASSSSLLDSLEDGGSHWMRVSGSFTMAANSDRTEGDESLLLTYDLTAAQAEIRPDRTPSTSSMKVFNTLAVDVRGDGTFNTLWANVTDATGETFNYRIDSLVSRQWKTSNVDLTKTLPITAGGNQDRVLDAPLTLTKLYVTRNASQPATGSVSIDNIRLLGDGWSTPLADPNAASWNFAAAAGEQREIRIEAGTAGDYRLVLADPTGRIRTITGSASAAGVVTTAWDGKSDSGELMAGLIRGQLNHDTSADGQLPAASAAAGQPFLTGISARVANEDNASIVGINADIVYAQDVRQMDSRAALAEAAHVRYDREELAWNDVESRQGYFTWSKTDSIVHSAIARNLEVVGKLGYSSQWASSAPAGTPESQKAVYPPRDLGEFVTYVEAVVERYHDKVHIWEVWNEPDGPAFWMPKEDPVAYAAMLKATYTAIKAIDPDAVVVSGGLAGFDVPFMEVLRTEGALQYMDGFGLHTFVDAAPEKSQAITWLEQAESYLQRYAPGVEIWLTELAWSTCTVGTGCTGPVSEATQASYLSRIYLDAAARGVAGIMWWNLVEYGNSNSKIDNYGLVDRSGRKKPGYTALQAVGKALDGHAGLGAAAPSEEAPVLISDMANSTGWQNVPLNGGTLSTTYGTQRHGGAAGARVEYTLPAANSAVRLQTSIPVSGTPTALSVWVYGDATANPIYLRFNDSSGETFTAIAGSSSKSEWKRLVYYLDGGNREASSGGGNNNKVIDYPITFTGVTIYRSAGLKFTTGKVFIDDVSAHYGTLTRGVVSGGGSTITKSLYSLTGGETMVAVSGSTTVSSMGSSQSVATNSQGRVPVSLSVNPSFVASAFGPSPKTVSAGALSKIQWSTGDRGRTALAIYSSSGALVRTLRTTTEYDAGLTTVYWDGRNSAGQVVRGDFIVRLTVDAPNGRDARVDAPLTVQ